MKILYSECTFGEKEKQAVLDVFDSGWLSGGKYTSKFEKALAQWWGVKYAVSVNSGSSANFIALQALNLKKPEVVTMAMGFPTTVSAIIYQNLTPVYVDCHLPSYTIDLKELEKAITKKTGAIIFAHTLGNVCNMDQVMKIVWKHGLKLIEDCCDAMGSTWKGKKVGTFGDLATVSFYPAHHMTTFGEGGAILTNNQKLYKIAKSIRDWGRDCYCPWNVSNACGKRFANPPFDHKYYYTRLGMNLKMTEAQAAFGSVQIDRLEDFINKRKHNFVRLCQLITNPDVILPVELSGASTSWFAFPILYKKNKQQFVEYLEKNGVQTRAIFAGNITRHPAYKGKGRVVGKIPNSNKVMRGAFFVGLGPKIGEKQLQYMGHIINKYQQPTSS